MVKLYDKDVISNIHFDVRFHFPFYSTFLFRNLYSHSIWQVNINLAIPSIQNLYI